MTTTPAPSPDAGAPPPIPLDVDDVVTELCSEPLGSALWGKAQWRVAADVLQRRVVELESQRNPATVPPDEWDQS